MDAEMIIRRRDLCGRYDHWLICVFRHVYDNGGIRKGQEPVQCIKVVFESKTLGGSWISVNTFG